MLALTGFGSGAFAAAAQASDSFAYVTNENAGTISRVNLTTQTAGTPIKVGSEPDAIAITPNGATAYVADHGSSEIVPVALATGAVGTPIRLSDKPNAIAITPDGATAYVISDAGRAWPIDLATRKVGTPIRIPTNSDAIAINATGTTAYITNVADGTVTPLSLTGGGLGKPINLTVATPDGIAIVGSGPTAYVTSSSEGALTSVNLTTGVSGNAYTAGSYPSGVAISADGSTAYVTNSTGGIMPVAVPSGVDGKLIDGSAQLSAIALLPAGAVTAGGGSGTGSGGSTSTGSSTNSGSGGTTGSGSTGGAQSGGTANGGGGGGGSTPAYRAAAPLSVGNQQLTLTLPGWPQAAGHAAVCRVPGSVIGVRLTRRMLRRGKHLNLRYVIFTLGRMRRLARRIPVTERFSLRGLRPGRYRLIVRAFFGELVRSKLSRPGRRTRLVTLTRTMTTLITVCGGRKPAPRARKAPVRRAPRCAPHQRRARCVIRRRRRG